MSLIVRREGAATLLLLDRPERAHAYNRALLEALLEAVRQVETSVVVIGSTGERAFCGGADLKEMKEVEPLSALDLLSQRCFEAIASAPWVSIAAVQGAAVAGGCELALACDLRVAGPRASFSLPETSLGLIPSAGGCTRLTRLVGAPRAKQVILGGGRIGAQQAEQWGLVNLLDDSPLEKALGWAQDIAKRDSVAQRLAKQVIDGASPTASSLQAERVAEALLYMRRRE